jgi:hypothetical protein
MSRRPSFTRKERLAKGLGVCAIDGCSRAPHRVRLCWAHYEDPATRAAVPYKRRPNGTPTATRTWDLRTDLALAISLEAERRGVPQAVLLEEVLSPIARTWGAPT